MTFGDTPIIALGFAAMLWATSGRADGIGESLMQVDPCWAEVLSGSVSMDDLAVIDELDPAAQLDAYRNNCKRPGIVALAQNYRPGDKVMFWHQPAPLPSPVPLPTSGLMLIAALAALGWKRILL